MGIFRIPMRTDDDTHQMQFNLQQYLLSPSLWATLFFAGLALMLGA